MEIKDIIRKKREELNLTYEELGNMVGVGKSTVRKWETGMIENMRRDNIVALSKALNISPAVIMGWEPIETKPNLSINNLNSNENLLLTNFNKLNELGQGKLLDYSNDLIETPKYIENDDFEIELLAAHNDNIDEDANKRNIEKIKAKYAQLKNKK